MPPEIAGRASQLTLAPSPFCHGCPAAGRNCNEQRTALGCHPSGPAHPTLLHPLNPEWFARYAEVNGFDLNYDAVAQPLPTLPPYIPAVRPNPWPGSFQSIEALAVPLSHVERLAQKVWKRGTSAKRLLGMEEHQMLIVLGFANDEFLERIWPEPDRTRVLRAIRAIEPDTAIAWNYSVWHRHASGWTHPRVEHLYNLKRSLKIYAQMQAIGIPAIPHVYWGIDDDLRRWAEWLSENPSINTVAIDLQTVDKPTAWRDAIRALRHLGTLLPRRIHVLFSGVCRKERVVELRRLWPESSLCKMGAWFAPQLRYKDAYGLDRPWAANPDHWSEANLFQEIVRQYTTLGGATVEPSPRSGPACDTSELGSGFVEPELVKFPTARTQVGCRQLSFNDVPHLLLRPVA